ncbi:MAG: transposase [Anaerolineales bacterium]|nr:transposase [Anaerolineales bacterium]
MPAFTALVVRSALPRGDAYLRLRDAIVPLFCDAEFADLFAAQDPSVETLWRLALMTALAFAENLTDRQVADVVATHLNWKYVLGLELHTQSFHFSALSEFRARLHEHEVERQLLDQFLVQVYAVGMVRGRGRKQMDSTQMLAAVRRLNRLDCVHETLGYALKSLEEEAPAWVMTHIPGAWLGIYCHRMVHDHYPKGVHAQLELAATAGQDGFQLLTILLAPTTPPALRTLPAIIVLWQVWLQQYDATTPRLRWRADEELPGADTLIDFHYGPNDQP